MKIKLFVAALFVLAVGVQTASAISFTENSLGGFYAGQDIDAIDVDGDGDIDIIGGAYASGGGVYWYEMMGAEISLNTAFTPHQVTIT